MVITVMHIASEGHMHCFIEFQLMRCTIYLFSSKNIFNGDTSIGAHYITYSMDTILDMIENV